MPLFVNYINFNLIDVHIVEISYMNEDELVIICHCSRHPTLYYRNGFTMTPVGKQVQYVDPVCPESRWDTIADNSKMYVYGMNCPIVLGILTRASDKQVYGTTILSEILENAWRVLKPGGKVLFPGQYTIDKNFIDLFQATIDTDENGIFKHKWKFTMTYIKDSSLDIGKTERTPESNSTYTEFRKPISSGSRMRRRTYKKRGTRLRLRSL